jgi:uncharacterized protein YjbI with pentapeptide repeats
LSQQQRVPTTPWWKNKKIIIWIVITAVLVVIVFIVLITATRTFHWQTGFTSSQKTTTTTVVTQPSGKRVRTTIEDQPAKTLWDWLPLLIQLLGALTIPIVIWLGTTFFTRQQAKTSETNTENQQQEELLRIYFDKISDLLLDKELSANQNIQSIVRARTLAALHMLNSERKAIVLRFLHDSGLLQYVKSFLYRLDLSNTDLVRIDLNKANLFEADLSGAYLFEANLSGANLNKTDLSGADLSGADLSGAYLNKANLSGANLNEANLSRASITLEQLKEAKNVTPEQLAQIKSSKPAALQEAKAEQASATRDGDPGEQLATILLQEAKAEQASATPTQSEVKPDQTGQKEAEQKEHNQPKQDTDTTY